MMWDDVGDKAPPKNGDDLRMIWQLQVLQVWNFDFAGLGEHSESHALRHSWRRDFSEQLFAQVVGMIPESSWFIDSWVNFITTRRDRAPQMMVNGFGKSSPFMAELFRLVNYCNLPR